MKIKIFIIILLFNKLSCLSQTKHSAVVSVAVKPISSDCRKAIPILLNNGYTYGPTYPPNGFGDLQEFKSVNTLTFEGEHNSAWHLLSIAKDGELIFDITPLDTTNDYDFLLYRYIDSNFCEQLQKNKLIPIRSNLSNIKKSAKGITGLQSSMLKNIIGEGIGDAYSKSIDVKKGEKYMLILDNVTPNGKGYTIHFYFMKKVEIRGQVVNSDNVPVKADITLSDNNGNTIEETKSTTDGNYTIKTNLIESLNYNMSFVADSTFIQVATINTKTLKATNEFPDIKVILPKLKKGEKYKLGNINFYGGQAILLPSSYPSVEALYKLMKRNKKMAILIEGHTNGEDWHKSVQYQDPHEKILSLERADMINDYLIKKGIKQDRLKTTGFGSTKPLLKNPIDEIETETNRRVEIKIISVD